MIEKEQLGLKIKELRKKKKITQEKLAEIIGVDCGYISKLEVGQNYPSIQTLNKISDALNIDIAEFFQYTNIHNKNLKEEIMNLLNDLPEEKLIMFYKFAKSVQ